MIYLIDEDFIDLKNKDKVFEILKNIDTNDVVIGGINSIDNAITELQNLGETKIINKLQNI